MPEASDPSASADEIFAEQVRRNREARGLSQDGLAGLLRERGLTYFTQTTLSRIENKTRPVRLAEAQAIAAEFELPMEALIARGDLAISLFEAHLFLGEASRVRTEVDALAERYGVVVSKAAQWAAKLEQQASNVDQLTVEGRALYYEVLAALAVAASPSMSTPIGKAAPRASGATTKVERAKNPASSG